MNISKMLNNVTVGLIAVGASTSLLAAHPGGNMQLPVASGIKLTVPQHMSSWNFAAEALYYRVANNDFQYFVTNTNVGSDSGEDAHHNHSVEPDYEWAFRLGATYHFAGNGRDATLSYTRIDASTSERFVFPGEITSATATDWWWWSVGDNTSDSMDITNGDAVAKSKDKYTDVDLVFGQKVDIGGRIRMHHFAGLRYADIDSNDKATYTNFTGTGTQVDVFRTTRYGSDFTGVGPRFGTDAQVNLGEGLSLRGKVGLSVLVGRMEQHGSIDEVDSAFASTNLADDFRTDSQTRIVPELDSRIGVNYATTFLSHANIELELGYEATNYFGAINKDIIGYTNNIGHEQNFAVMGPYLRLDVNMM
jgi:hypothetical protein